ncbi:MAG TPA: hypothetical protein VF592_02370 [Sphingomonas sp.]|jgi:hypothetical protein|uniref:hypothetical protein n=1 Tax=Sphingomonas sp. TaxID=28214 RepID=UPI002ED78B5D
MLLPLSAPFTLADNSYGAQVGAIDVSQWTWMGMGCRGSPTLGLVQARGGDRLSHLIDRIAPVKSCSTNGVALIMNVENDLSDAAISPDAAGGDVLLARLDAVIGEVRVSGGKVAIAKQAGTNSAIGTKAPAVARYNEGLAMRVAPDLVLLDDGAAFDPQDATQSSDGVHPNRAGSARALGSARGSALAALFDRAGIFDGGGQLPGNFNTNWNMGTLGVLTNNSGATASRTAGFLRSRPEVPCQILSLSGSVTADPAGAAATGDVQLRFATPHPAGTATTGKSPICFAFVEISDAAGGDPVGLASLGLHCGQSTGFGKTYNPAHGPWGGGSAYVGPIGTARPRQIAVQSLALNTDLVIRGMQRSGVDVEVRIAWLNVVYTDEAAYGPAANASAVFTTGRPVLFALPTTTPAAGPLAVGATLGIGSVPATIVGGGLTRRFHVIRGGTTEVGAIAPATAAAGSTAYMIQAADSGSALAVRSTAGNDRGGEVRVSSGALTVT